MSQTSPVQQYLHTPNCTVLDFYLNIAKKTPVCWQNFLSHGVIKRSKISLVKTSDLAITFALDVELVWGRSETLEKWWVNSSATAILDQVLVAVTKSWRGRHFGMRDLPRQNVDIAQSHRSHAVLWDLADGRIFWNELVSGHWAAMTSILVYYRAGSFLSMWLACYNQTYFFSEIPLH